MNRTRQSHAVRWLWAGALRALGAAGVLLGGSAWSADQCAPTTCTPNSPNCQQCQTVFDDAALKLKNLNPGCCTPATSGCTSDGQPASACEEAPAAAPELWTLTDVFTDPCGNNHLKNKHIKIGGNLAQSFAYNFQSPRDRWNGPVTWTDRSNDYELNQAWLYVEKATDTSEHDWDIGGRADGFWGTNARLTTETGLEVGHVNPANSIYGWAFPNLYAEIAYKKWKVRAGHFVSPIGYFTVDTTQNFFNTIPYTYQWGEPFTHTGVNAIYQAADNFAVSGAIIRGWDNFDNSNPHAGFLGTWNYTFKDKSNLAQVIVYSMEPNFSFAFTQRYYQSLVYTKPLSEKWNYVGQSDFGTQENATFNGKRANWYGLNQYLYYTMTDRLTMGVNFEWWRDEEGYRVAGFLPGTAPSGITGPQAGWGNLGNTRAGYTGNFYQITCGPKWFPTTSNNFFVRPNMRFDWFSGDINPTLNPALNKPYGSGHENWQALFVTDVVLLF